MAWDVRGRARARVKFREDQGLYPWGLAYTEVSPERDWLIVWGYNGKGEQLFERWYPHGMVLYFEMGEE